MILILINSAELWNLHIRTCHTFKITIYEFGCIKSSLIQNLNNITGKNSVITGYDYFSQSFCPTNLSNMAVWLCRLTDWRGLTAARGK